jgi:hypothetical protein
MPWPDLTRYLIVGTIVVLGLYDLVALGRGGPDATISRVALDLAVRYPLFPFALGVLAGHILAAQPHPHQ